MFYSWIPSHSFHYYFDFFHLLFFSFLSSCSRFSIEPQVGLEVAHPGVANDFNDEGERNLRVQQLNRDFQTTHPQMPKSIIHTINGCALCCFSKVGSMPAISFAGQHQPNALFMRRGNLSIKSLLNARNDSVTLIQ